MRWPFALSLALHGGGLIALCVVHGRGGGGPARVTTLVCMQADEWEGNPEVPEVPDPPELQPTEIVIEREPFPEEAEEPEPIDFAEFDAAADPSPEPLPVQRQVRIPPLRRPTRVAPAPPAPAPSSAAAASHVITAMPRGDRCRPPAYPLAAQRRGVEGHVVLRVLVGTDGGVLSIEVEESSGAQALDDAAVAAVRGWTFEPAREDGRAVESIVRVPFAFRLRR